LPNNDDEPEMAFCDLEDNANLAEEFIQYIIRYAIENNANDQIKKKPNALHSAFSLFG
jgi:aspartyl/asparaginyl-tRNA synthetase